MVKNFYDIVRHPKKTSEGTNVVAVSAAMRRVAFAYERFRNTLEPDEEDVLRRKAIARILVRRLAENRFDEVTAMALLQELIRGNYIKGASMQTVHHITHEVKSLRLLSPKMTPTVQEWFVRVATVSIDRELFPKEGEEFLVQLFYYDVFRRAVWVDDLVNEDDRATQLYVATHRALFEADNYEISYHYFINYLPDWKRKELNEENITEIAGQISDFYPKIQKILFHPARQRLSYLMRRPAVPYRILRDVFQNSEFDPLVSSEKLESATVKAVSDRQELLKARMNRRATHSILFLLVTKTILAFLVELPYEKFLLGTVYWLPLATNILFHPALLFVLSTSVRFPGVDNTAAIVEHIKSITTSEGYGETIVIRSPRQYGSLTWSGFALIYAILFMGIFWGMFTVLDYIHFSLVAMALFIVFLGLVSFLAIRVRRSADQIRVLAVREGSLGIMGSFVALPVLEFGSWMARHISQLNVLLFLMDRILEAPFKLFIDITEEWFVFVRDRREEIM